MRTVCFEMKIPQILLTRAVRPLWPGISFSSLSPTRMLNLPDPPLPGRNWVRIRNTLCGVCATDLYFLHTEADPRIAGAALPGTQRFYLGHELVGVVSEVGPEVTDLQVGDRVCLGNTWQGGTCLNQELPDLCGPCAQGNPALCENASLHLSPGRVGGGWGDGFLAHATDLFPVPPQLDDSAAMMIEPMMVGVRAVLRCLPAAGQRALVVGSGIVGLNVVQALRALAPECHLTAMARYPHQAQMARALGAHEVITGQDDYARVADITGGKLYTGMFGNRMILGGFDVVYDCVGSSPTVRDSLRWARAGGTVVLVGVLLKPMTVDLTPVWYQEVRLVGSMVHGMEGWQQEAISTFHLTCDLMVGGRLTTAGLITHRFPLDRWRQAVQTAGDKASGAIKVAIEIR